MVTSTLVSSNTSKISTSLIPSSTTTDQPTQFSTSLLLSLFLTQPETTELQEIFKRELFKQQAMPQIELEPKKWNLILHQYLISSLFLKLTPSNPSTTVTSPVLAAQALMNGHQIDAQRVVLKT